MGKRKDKRVAKVSISMPADVFLEAQGRAAELGMDSFSKYVSFVLREDLVRRGNLVISQRQPPPPPPPPEPPKPPGKPRKGGAK